MNFKLKESDSVSVIEIHYDITTSNINELKELLSGVLKVERPRMVLKFMPEATFVCSAGIGFIATVYKEINKKNGRLAMCGMSMDISEIMERVRLNNLIKFFKSEEEALNYVRS